jgi:Ca2+-binding RTX toxin-like protein
MVSVNRHDLDFILAQIKIAEAHADGTPLNQLVVDPHLPFGLRTVNGTYNNLIEGRELWGSADQVMPRLVPLTGPLQSADINPRTGQPTSYNQYSGSVFDADPRIISNLIADQSFGNIAAVSAALVRFSGLDSAEIVPAAQTIIADYKAYLAILNDDASTPDGIIAARTEFTGTLTQYNIDFDTSPKGDINVRIPDVSPDEGLTAPFNTWMTLFGQFFDHGLDLVSKGGSGTVFIPLSPDDPLYDPTPGANNFMVMTRATNQPGPDGILGTPDMPGADGIFGTADDIPSDDIREHVNKTTPWVDQNQTYTSHASHQVFLREYKMVEVPNPNAGQPDEPLMLTIPASTGKLLEGSVKGMATWADVKAQALELGIRLSDHDVHSVPLLVTDEYGNLILSANGFIQMVKMQTTLHPDGVTIVPLFGADGKVVIRIVECDPADPMSTDFAVPTGHAFLEDIAHAANPGTFDLDGNPGTRGDVGIMVADDDLELGLAGANLLNANGVVQVYDNELLDKHYIAGDGRANENIGLTAVHHIFHSEHNRQVDAMKATILASGDLAFVNEWLATDLTTLDGATPETLDWDGARLFQSARFATEMQYQHMVFEEFGRRVHPAIDAFIFNSITDIDPAIVAEFAHVVYRFGHSMLTENVPTINFGMGEMQTDLIGAFLNPVQFDGLGATDSISAGAVIRGAIRETGNSIDEFVTSALRNNLVGLPLDLAALNIARGRDTGMPTLQQARETFYTASGSDWLKPYTSWADFAVNIKNPASIVNFIAAYGTHSSLTALVPAPTDLDPTATRPMTVEERRDAAIKLVLGDPTLTGDAAIAFDADRLAFLNATDGYAGGSLGGLNNVDFWIGGLAENIMPFGGMLGSSFAFVFEVQMENLQNNDRFYYLTRTQGLNMINELENNSFASIIMKNTDFGMAGSHLPGEVFGNVDYILEVNEIFQIGDDPTDTAFDPFLTGMQRAKVERDIDGLTVGARDYDNKLQFRGGEHVVLGGTNDRNVLIGDVGDDTAWGDGGDDLIIGGAGVNHLRGGAGNDIILDGGDVSFTHGEDGDDVIHTGAGAAELTFGGDGNDVIIMGEDDAKHALAGEGNDFILGGAGADLINGNEGDDWIEGKGGFDVISGDNSELFFNSTIIGHDIMFAGDNETDFDAESGDDIMVMGESVIRAEGMFGFDWVTYKDVRVSADLDLNRKIFATDQADILRNRFDRVEGASGFDQNDLIQGDDRAGGDLEEGVTLGQNETNFAGHELTQEGIDRIDNLRAVLGSWVNENDLTFTKGNILLGGGGDDTIMGRGGDDFIDGDHWLNVRIQITGPRPVGVNESIDSLSEIMTYLLDGTIKPSQLVMVREVVNGNVAGDSDTAQFWDIAANYNVTRLAGGTVIVTHVTESDPADLNIPEAAGLVLVNEGTDTLRNIEVLRFADRDVLVGSLDIDVPTTADIILSDTTPSVGQALTVAVTNIVDTVGPVTFTLQWQHLHDGTWTDLEGETGNTFVPTADELGEPLRVVVTATDGDGNVTQLISAITGNITPFEGTAGNDLLNGTAADDLINGLAGADTINGGGGADVINGGAGADVINGQGDADILAGNGDADIINGGAGADTIDGGEGADTINGGAGNDLITWSVGGGRDLVNGAGGGVDTFVVDGDVSAESFRVVAVAGGVNTTLRADIAAAFGPLAAATEIVIIRSSGGIETLIAELDNIEEIAINTLAVSGATGGLPVGSDTVEIVGNFTPTSLALNTITINGSAANDTVDITALQSAHRILFRSNGGEDTIVGTLRSQDVIEIAEGADPTAFDATDNEDGTVTMSDGTHSVTFTGSITALPTLAPKGTHQPGEDESESPDEDNSGTGSGTGTGAGNGTGSGTGTGAGTGTGSGTGTVDADTDTDGVIVMPGSGAGVQVGGADDDVLVGGDAGDALIGKAGADIILGNGGNDVATGGSGADIIEGGAGRDVQLGGAGDDIFIVQNGDGSDMIFGGAGSDTLDLSAVTGGAVIDLGAYTPIGTVKSGGVTDHLMGVENVIGSEGADTIKAGLAINVMTGGDGEDIFVFVSAGTANGDVITDFRPGDKIDLSGIDAMFGTAGNQSFTLADQGTTAAGNLVIREVNGANGVDTIIDGFTDDDADADFSITLRGGHTLTDSSFNF